MASGILTGFPTIAPDAPTSRVRFADVAVTATANEFAGIHRNKKRHEPDFSAVLERATATGVDKVMLTGMSLNDVDFNLEIAKSHPKQCSITVGVHPYHASELAEDGEYAARLAKTVQELLSQSPCLIKAYGELGLDYDRVNHASKETQIHTFKSQLDVFVENKFDLPLFLHCRSAFDDFVEIIQPYLKDLPRKGLVHSFVGSTEQMLKLVELGFDVSVNGFSFRDHESLEMVAAIPLEHLQLETDAPWGDIPANSELAKRYLVNAKALPPSKKYDKFEMGSMVKGRNESCAIDRVAFIVAGLKGMRVEDLAERAWTNSVSMFRLEDDNES